MATKEDILEQIVEDYLIHKGYFVQHNLKFLPSSDHPDYVVSKDSNHSDIDVIGFHPRLDGPEKVMVVSCKSWQRGFNPAAEIAAIDGNKKRRGSESWQSFRELTKQKWSEGFRRAIGNATGCHSFTYVTAVTRLSGDRLLWEEHEPFRSAIGGNPIKILTLREMVEFVQVNLTTTPATTEIGRLLQLLAAADMTPSSHPLRIAQRLAVESTKAMRQPTTRNGATRSALSEAPKT